VLTIALGNHAWGLGLGGGAGMLWVGLELVAERLAEGTEREAIVLAGDQERSDAPSPAAGVALLFAREPAPHAALGRTVRLVTIERRRNRGAATPHAAAGACAMLAALEARPPGRFDYAVPAAHGDGVDDLTITWELG
jgi:hypothetical protein